MSPIQPGWTASETDAAGERTLPLPTATPRRLAALLLSYPLFYFAGRLLNTTAGGPAALWPPDAVIFLALLMLPARHWVWVALVTAAADQLCILVIERLIMHVRIASPMPGGASLWYAIPHVLTPFGPVVLARALDLVRFDRVRRIVDSPLWMAAILLGTLPGAILGNWMISLREGIAITELGVVIWIIAATLGIMLFAPALALILKGDRQHPDQAPGQPWEAVAIAVLVALSYGLYELIPTLELERVPSLLLQVFPLSWLALRFSRRIVYLAVPLVAMSVAFIGAHGNGSDQKVVDIEAWQNPLLAWQLSILAICGATMFISYVGHKQRALLEALRRDGARLRWYAAELDHAEDDARRRIAEELHDGIAQSLTGQSLLLASLRPSLSEQPALNTLAEAEAAAAQAQQHVRSLIAELHPAELEATTLAELLESIAVRFEQRYGFQVITEVTEDVPVPSDALRLTFRVVCELIFNAYRHSHGTRVTVQARSTGQQLLLEVWDDGIGFARAPARPRGAGHGLGLVQLRERVEAAGGSLHFGSRDGTDSLVSVALPLRIRQPGAPQA